MKTPAPIQLGSTLEEFRVVTIRLQGRPVNGEVRYEAQVDRLRHSKFVGLREDKDTRRVVKEHSGRLESHGLKA
jgi:hypothetical protein